MFWLAILAGFYLISSRLWWDGTGFCVGSLVECGLWESIQVGTPAECGSVRSASRRGQTGLKKMVCLRFAVIACALIATT